MNYLQIKKRVDTAGKISPKINYYSWR